MTGINETIIENAIPVVQSQAIDPFWLYLSIGVTVGFMIFILVFFLGESLKLRLMMLGRQRMGYGVIEIIHRNGRRTLHPKKFEREVTVDSFLFKPKYDQDHLFRNEYGMPTVQFNVRSIENVPIVNKEEPEAKDERSLFDKIKRVPAPEKKKSDKTEVPENCQVKANKPPLVMTDPAEDLQSHMAFYQAGLLKGGSLSDKLLKMITVSLILTGITMAVCAYGLYKLGAFA